MPGVIGVTGATGGIGGRVAERLASSGHRQRLIVRDAARAPALPGADVVEYGGYEDPESLRRACDGIGTLFLVSMLESRDRVARHRAAVDAAVAAGVERIVYLSFAGAAPDATFTFARDHFHTEEHVRASGLRFTFSRQNLYMDLLPFLAGPDGVIRGPAGEGRVVPVARDDVADALHAILTGDGHDGATYTLTGLEAFTLAQVAAELSEALGRPVTFRDETLEEAYASREPYGAPDWEVEGWVTTYLALARGEMEAVTGDVERLTGHPPTRVREFLKRQAAAAPTQ